MPEGSDDVEEIEKGGAEKLLGKPFVHNKKPSGYGELATKVKAILEIRSESEKPDEESTDETPPTVSVTDSVTEGLTDDDDADDDGDSGDDVAIVEANADGDLVENDENDEEDADEGDAEDEDELVEVEQDDEDNDGEVEENDDDDDEAKDEDDEEEEDDEDEPVGVAVDVGEEPESVVGTDPDAISPGQDFVESRFAGPDEGRGTYVAEWVKRICENGNEMVVLGQLVFWFQPGKNGKIKANKLLTPSVYYWVAKSYRELGLETGLEEWQVRHAIKRLALAGFVVKENHLFQNLVTNHFRLDPYAIAQALSTQEEAE